MLIEEFLNRYFVDPIFDKVGYNPVNTVVYALIALGALFAIYSLFKKYKVQIDLPFIKNALMFVVLGSTVRVITDSIDNNNFKMPTLLHEWAYSSGVYQYGWFTVTPGIYIIVAALFLLSFTVFSYLKKPHLTFWFGFALWIFHLLLLLPTLVGHWWIAIPIAIIALVPASIAYTYFSKEKEQLLYTLIVLGQSLDGAATWISIDFSKEITGISYFEQHVVSSFIGSVFGSYITFFIVKALLSFVIAHFLSKEKLGDNERRFIALIIMIIGFAPGIRNSLRLIGGT